MSSILLKHTHITKTCDKIHSFHTFNRKRNSFNHNFFKRKVFTVKIYIPKQRSYNDNLSDTKLRDFTKNNDKQDVFDSIVTDPTELKVKNGYLSPVNNQNCMCLEKIGHDNNEENNDMKNEYLFQILKAKVYDVALRTPLEKALKISEETKNIVYLKREDLQPVFSFKIRGAYNKMSNLSKKELENGVVCSSAGNHAQGVALSASKLVSMRILYMNHQ